MKKPHVWFRAYAEALDDPKIQRLHPTLFKGWFNILCVACQNDGLLPSNDDIAFKLRISAQDAAQMMDELTLAGLIDIDPRGGRTPHNWNGRQYVSDSSAERVRRYREKRKALGMHTSSDYSRYRPELIARDGEACVYCASERNLVVDHMHPVDQGGTDDIDNLALACRKCNAGKSGRTPEQAGMQFVVTSAETAMSRYMSRRVTVTVTAPEQNRTEQTRAESDSEQTAPKREAVEKILHDVRSGLVGVGRVSDAAKRKAAAKLAVSTVDPLLILYEQWDGSRRARNPDSHFLSVVEKFWSDATAEVRAACGPLVPAAIEPLPPVTPSFALRAALRRTDRNGH